MKRKKILFPKNKKICFGVYVNTFNCQKFANYKSTSSNEFPIKLYTGKTIRYYISHRTSAASAGL